MDCINLKERFGDRFKIAHEESYDAERPDLRAAEEPWLQIMPCKNGHICPWGGIDLAACTKAGSIAKALRRMPYIWVAQDASDGINAVFDIGHFDDVAELMKPRRRRRLSHEGRARLAAAGAATRFAKDYGIQDDSDERRCVGTALVDV